MTRRFNEKWRSESLEEAFKDLSRDRLVRIIGEEVQEFHKARYELQTNREEVKE